MSAAPASAPIKPAKHDLQAAFAAAAAEYHVPKSVLLAVSYQETLWESHHGAPSATDNYNVMGLTLVTDPSVLAPAVSTGTDESTDGRGDGAAGHHRTPRASARSDASVPRITPAMRTLAAAASLTGASQQALRTDPKQSVRGGAALLASYEKAAHGSLPSNPAAWYDAVARYSHASNAATERLFANRVYATIRTGAGRITGDNEAVTLPADPSVAVKAPRSVSLDLQPSVARQASTSSATPAVECPSTLPCTFTPAAYQQDSSTDPTNYGNYDIADRPSDGGTIDTIVIHDTESSAASAISSFQQPTTYASAHYVIGADGSVTQMVPTKDIAWHAGNKYTNDHSIGIEHEGYALGTSAKYSSWYTEQEYESSAALVKYLAGRFAIPLDREHIIGHDDVAAPLTAYYSGMHWDPGPWWNWGHYLALLGASPNGTDMPVVGGEVTIDPPYSTGYEPALTGCGGTNVACPGNPVNFVYLRTGPASSYPLITDPYLKAQGDLTGTTVGWDWSDKAVLGQTFVVAGVQGNWTAIWYDGQKAWFYNPGGAYTMANTGTEKTLVTPAGSSAVQVYGRAYPDSAAYPAGVTAQPVEPLTDQTIQPGQAYTALPPVTGDFYWANDYNCSDGAPDCTVIKGTTQYYPIRYNHRLAYVKTSDVTTTAPVVPPTGTLQPVTPTRLLDTRDGTGGYSQPVGSGASISLTVAGKAGVPTTGVTGVVLNVTAINPTKSGFVTVYPDGGARPSTSNVNFAAGTTIPVLVAIPVTDGKVDFYNNAGSVDLAADINGYFTSDGSGSKYTSLAPHRILDTRYGTGGVSQPLGADSSIQLAVEGAGGVPSTGVTAVAMNVTAVSPTATSFVSVYPDSGTRPQVSNLNFTAGTTISNLVIVPVGSDGKVDLWNHTGSVDLVADVEGYYSSSGGVFHSAGPVRVMDTRYGTGVPMAKVQAGGTVTLTVGGAHGVPVNATAVVLNVTVTGPTKAGFVTVFPYGSSVPNASNVNFAAGETISNLVVVPVVNGKVTFYNHAGTVDIVADLTGFYTA